MRDFKALAFGCEQHSVIANYITTANGSEADGVTRTLAGMTFTAVYRHFRQVAT